MNNNRESFIYPKIVLREKIRKHMGNRPEILKKAAGH